MQLSKKQKTFGGFSFAIFEIYIKFWAFSKKKKMSLKLLKFAENQF